MVNMQPSETLTEVQPQSSSTELFRKISQYPFAADNEWLLGLSTILGHPETPPTSEELSSRSDLILQAQCFYLARKFNLPPINVAAYKEYQTSQGIPGESSTSPPPPRPSAPTPQTASTGPSATTSETEPAPPYPTSFAEIVDLITQNKPIPGIEEVPTTVLEPGSSKQDHASRRRKPWEKNEASASDAAPVEVDGEAITRSGVGVMKILQPNAVPDSGLIAKE